MGLTRITKGVIKPNEDYQTGIITATGIDVNGDADISGNLSVGGVLTYEDVTSIAVSYTHLTLPTMFEV